MSYVLSLLFVVISILGGIQAPVSEPSVGDLRIITVPQGGTGTSTITVAGVVYGNGTAKIQATAACADGEIIKYSSGIPACGADSTGGGAGGTGTVATSSAETQFRVPFWDSISATPALLNGGDSTFTYNPTTGRLTFSYGSTTAITSVVASTTDLIVSSLNSASCDVKASTSGILSCGTDATGAGGSGLSTTTPISDSNILVYSASGAGAAYGVATGTVSSANTALTVTAGRSVIGGALSLTVATTSTNMFSGTGGDVLAYSNAFGGWFPQATSTMNVGTASALFANGSNCSAGNFPLGVDASGAVETCTDAWTEAENTSAAYLDLADLTAISKGFFFSTTSSNYYTSAGLSWSTTSADAWKDTRNFFSTTSSNYYTSVGLSWSTTSADAWKNVNNFFSTTSANYFTSVGLSWSTTSAIHFVDASTTIPKTYTANTWSLHNIFSSIFATNSSSTNATTTNLHITSLNCSGNTNGGALTTDANGRVTCSDDDSGGGGSGTVNTGLQGQFPYYAANGTTLSPTSSLAFATTSEYLTSLNLFDATFATNTLYFVSNSEASSTATAASSRFAFGAGIVDLTNDFALNGGAVELYAGDTTKADSSDISLFDSLQGGSLYASAGRFSTDDNSSSAIGGSISLNRGRVSSFGANLIGGDVVIDAGTVGATSSATFGNVEAGGIGLNAGGAGDDSGEGNGAQLSLSGAATSTAFWQGGSAILRGGQSNGNLHGSVTLETVLGELKLDGLTGFVGIGTTSPYKLLSVGGEVLANNFTATTSNATSSFTNLIATGNASTSNLIVSNLNATNCDVKANAFGLLSCGTDATGGGGGTPDSKWATSTNNAIYPSGLTNSVIIGTTTQYFGTDVCYLCVYATSTAGDLIFASSTQGFGGNLINLQHANGTSLLSLNASGDFTLARTTGVNSLEFSPGFFQLLDSSGGTIFSVTETGTLASELLIGGGGSTLTFGSDLTFTHTSDLLTLTGGTFSVSEKATVGTTTSANYQLTVASSTAPQIALSAGPGIAQWAVRNAGGNLYFATTTVAGTATSSQAAVEFRNSTTGAGLGVGTSSPWRTLSVTGTAAINGLSTAAGTPNDVCINASTKELVENAALTCTVSSIDFKQNVINLENGLDLLMDIQPVQFEYKDKPERGRWGFIAEWMKDIDPKLADGYDATNIPRSIDQNAILAVAVKSIQEIVGYEKKQDARLWEVEQRLYDMEERIEQLVHENSTLKAELNLQCRL